MKSKIVVVRKTIIEIDGKEYVVENHRRQVSSERLVRDIYKA
jgi:hypothetical protein